MVAALLARPERREPIGRLTAREREVLALMAEGRSNAAIAAKLFVTDKAIDKHINNIFVKLDLPMDHDDNRRVLAVLRYLQNTATPSPLCRWSGAFMLDIPVGRREAVRGRGEARCPGGIGYGRLPAARPQLVVRSHQYATSGPR